MSRRVTRSIDSLREYVDSTVARVNNIPANSNITIDDINEIHFDFNMHIIDTLTGAHLQEKKDKSGRERTLPKSFFLFNPLPNATEEREINIIYDRYMRDIEPVLKQMSKDNQDEMALIDPRRAPGEWDIPDEKVTGKKLEEILESAFAKHLTKNDLITLRAMAERLRRRNRLFLFGIAFAAVIGGFGCASMINKRKSDYEYGPDDDWDDDDMEPTNMDDVPEVTIDDDIPELPEIA